MTTTNRAIGEQVNLATVLNGKLEAPILQSEMGLDAQATATGKAVRWDEFSVKHNNDGSFKTGAINQADVALTTQATATQKPVRWDEWTKRHNDTGTIKQQMYKKSQASNPSATIDTYGAAVTNTPATNFTAILPLGVDIVFGGTFGAETVTAQIVVTYSDATTATLTKTAVATGTTTLTATDLMGLVKDGVYITQSSFNSKSSIASSTATVTFNRYGLYI